MTGSQSNLFTINVNVEDVVLTPLSSAALVNEFVKGLLYQKNQIPYPFSWMKTVVDKKRKKDLNPVEETRKNLKAQNHFRQVSTTFDLLENLMKNIELEFSSHKSAIKEVVIVFGTTPQCPKEVFTIRIEDMAEGHRENQHLGEFSKQQNRILRNVFLSQPWMDTISAGTSCTNTYFYLKKSHDYSSVEPSHFLLTQPLFLSATTKQFLIKFLHKPDELNCCENLRIFGENVRREKTPEKQFPEQWFSSKSFVKGFKGCFVDKVSACELW